MAIGIASLIGASLDMRNVASVKNQKPKTILTFMYTYHLLFVSIHVSDPLISCFRMEKINKGKKFNSEKTKRLQTSFLVVVVFWLSV